MRTLPTANYEKERVQGGKDNEHLVALIDRERELCLQVAKLSVEIDNAFTGAGRLILLLDNKDKDRDVLYAVYLYGKSYFDVAKEFGYDVDYVRVKIHKAKNKLVNITNSKGFPKDFFSD
jgi:hypothetical protein